MLIKRIKGAVHRAVLFFIKPKVMIEDINIKIDKIGGFTCCPSCGTQLSVNGSIYFDNIFLGQQTHDSIISSECPACGECLDIPIQLRVWDAEKSHTLLKNEEKPFSEEPLHPGMYEWPIMNSSPEEPSEELHVNPINDHTDDNEDMHAPPILDQVNEPILDEIHVNHHTLNATTFEQAWNHGTEVNFINDLPTNSVTTSNINNVFNGIGGDF